MDEYSENEEARRNGVQSKEMEERTKVGLMRALVEAKEPSSQKVDDEMLRRFLRAREMDIEKASALFLKYIKWRRSFVPNGSISESQIPNQLSQNKMFLQGSDKKGRPITVIFGARHFPSALDEFKRKFTVHDMMIRMPEGQEKFVGIGDLEGWGYANSDIRGYIGSLSILQIVFVDNERLKSTLLQEIDESQLPEVYGGKLPLVPIQDSKPTSI
ncbi:phosphatidylinositol/phosphatidylcholine transfer protein SFH12-like isoform X5 [Malania oleifera]|uniref:phosphatidylinositol/phosphatidylcholine transfer protein SFH12-like isoform X5 n=1 Tax=Malania oleifera TaxID=397392 RepID=UPI0025AE08B8|nr:phosphatidylinositol/phosphatidylcholine transfer protein SFH12-like isoform X5 [Malania oleifera]